MANNALIGAVRAEATLESGKFVSGAKKIRQEAKATETQLKKSFSAMGSAAKGFGGALTAGLSIGLLGGLAKKALDFAGSLGEVAQQIGVTAKDLQTLRYAGGQFGVSAQEMDKALQKFTKSLGDARNGSAEAIKTFKAIGFTDQDIKKLDVHDALLKTADGIAAIGDRASRASPEVRLFGKTGQNLDPLLSQGSKGINALAQAAEKLGIVLSDEQIRNADETADKLEAVRTVLAAQIAGTVAENAQSILSLAQALATLTSSVVNFLGSNPQAALGIIGALAGSRFGIAGAAVGGLTGLGLGGKMAAQRDRSSLDVGFLGSRLKEENDILKSYIAKNQKGAAINTGPQRKKVLELLAQFNQARAAQGKAGAVIPSVPLPQFLASGGGGGGKKRTPKAPRDRSDDVAYQFESEMRRAQMDTLRAQQSLATTVDDRVAIALQILDLQKEEQEAELKDRVRRAERDFAEGKIDAQTLQQVKAQAESLRAEYAKTDALERQAIAEDLAAQKAEDAAALADSDYELQIEMAQLEASLAETTEARKAAELRILELMKQQEKARLEAVIADKDSSELAKEEARRRLEQLDKIYAGRAAATEAGNRNPIEDYKARYADIGEENQQAIVGFLEDEADALSRVTDGWKEMKKAALDALKSLVQTLLRNQINQLFASLIPSAGFGGALPGFASGGFTGFGSSTSIAGFVHGREGVLNQLGMRTLGIPNLEALNRGVPLSAVSNDNDWRRRDGGGRIVNQYFDIKTPDANSFRRSEGQLARSAKRKLGVVP